MATAPVPVTARKSHARLDTERSEEGKIARHNLVAWRELEKPMLFPFRRGSSSADDAASGSATPASG